MRKVSCRKGSSEQSDRLKVRAVKGTIAYELEHSCPPGRYLTSPSQANGAPQSLAVADALIDKVRRKA